MNEGAGGVDVPQALFYFVKKQPKGIDNGKYIL